MKYSAILLVLALCAGPGELALAQQAPAPSDPTSNNAPAETTLAAPAPTPVETHVVTPVQAAPAPGEPPIAQPAPTPPVAVPTGRTSALPPPQPLVASGRWSGDFTAALTAAAGNTQSYSLNLGADATYQRSDDKLSLLAQYMESSARGVDSNGAPTSSVTALQWRLGGRYDRDVTTENFGFVGLDFSQDQISKLALRSVISSGVGRHLVKLPYDQWDVFGGLTYREDIYYPPGVTIDGEQKVRYDTMESLLGEESTHALTDTVRLKQKFVVYPNMYNGKGTRALLDAGLQVDVDKALSLSVKLQGRYDSMAEAPAQKYDLLFMTGLTVRFGG